MALPNPGTSDQRVLETLNQLIAETWDAIVTDLVTKLQAELTDALVGKKAKVSGAVVPVVWLCPLLSIDPSIKVKEASIDNIDLASPPGYGTFSDDEVTLLLPRGEWSLGVRLGLETSIAGIGDTVIRAAIRGLQATASLRINHQDRRRPTVADVNLDVRWGKIDLDARNLLAACVLEFIEKYIARLLVLEKIAVRMIGLLEKLFDDLEIQEPREALVQKIKNKLVDMPLEGHARNSPFYFTTKEGIQIDLCPADPQTGLRNCNPQLFLNASRDIYDYELLANRMDEIIQERFLPVGTLVTIAPECFNETKKSYYGTRVGDSATRTGYYLVALALRYAITGSAVAQANVNRLLDGIGRLLAVGSSSDLISCTGEGQEIKCLDETSAPKGTVNGDELRPAQFAASGNGCTVALALGESCPKTWERFFQERSARRREPVSVRRLDGENWFGISSDVSRDPYLAIVAGMAFAYKLVPVAEVRAKVRTYITGMLKYLLRHAWTSRDPRGNVLDQGVIFTFHPHIQLPMLLLGALANPGENWRTEGQPPETFQQALERLSPIARSIWFPIWFDTFNPVDGYFKFVLAHVGLATALLLDEDQTRREEYRRSMRIMRQAVGHYQNPLLNGLYAMDPELRQELWVSGEGLKTYIEIHQFLQRARENTIPIDRITQPIVNLHNGLSAQGLIVKNPYKERAGRELGNFFLPEEEEEESAKTLAAIVMPVDLREPKIFFLWERSPFQQRSFTRLFNWEAIPGEDTPKLIEFVEKTFELKGISPADVVKQSSGKVIRATVGQAMVTLTLNDEGDRVVAKISDCRKQELVAIQEQRQLNIYSPGGSGEEGPGADYVMAYWLARRAGFMVHLAVNKGCGSSYTDSETVKVTYMLPMQESFSIRHQRPGGDVATLISGTAGEANELQLPIGLPIGQHRLQLRIKDQAVAECSFTIVPS